MSNFFQFIKSKQFFINLGIIAASVVLIFFITIKGLDSYTNHGEYIEVPDFKGKKITELTNFVKDKELAIQIIDSIYDPKQTPGIVVRQDPEVNSKVKHNRTIYLYVTGMVAPQIIMPKLVDLSERQAKFVLNSYGLKLGKVDEKSADCNGCIIAQSYNGKNIQPGTPIKKGSTIGLVIGRKDYYFTASSTDSSLITTPNFNDPQNEDEENKE